MLVLTPADKTSLSHTGKQHTSENKKKYRNGSSLIWHCVLCHFGKHKKKTNMSIRRHVRRFFNCGGGPSPWTENRSYIFDSGTKKSLVPCMWRQQVTWIGKMQFICVSAFGRWPNVYPRERRNRRSLNPSSSEGTLCRGAVPSL